MGLRFLGGLERENKMSSVIEGERNKDRIMFRYKKVPTVHNFY